jgi:quercetin dioxygenase-like cupin family protein
MAKDLLLEPGGGEQTRLGSMGVDFKIWGEQTGGAFSVVEHPIDPRGLAPPHRHENEDELSYVIEGVIGARQGDEEVQVEAGGYLMKPRGILHSFWNPTDEPARILEIISPGGFEHYFKDLGEYFASGQEPDPGKIAEIAGRYDLTFDFTWLPEIVQRYGLTPPG